MGMHIQFQGGFNWLAYQRPAKLLLMLAARE
jgi:hypothetical protein